MTIGSRRTIGQVVAVAAVVVAVAAAPSAPLSSNISVEPTADALPEPPPLPVGSSVPGHRGAERSAIALAGALSAVPARDGSLAPPCPEDRLEVSWDEPSDDFRRGAYVGPVGPAPSAQSDEASGIVVCRGSSYAFMGFEGVWDGSRWEVFAVPDLGEERQSPPNDGVTGSPPLALPAGLNEIQPGSPWYDRWDAEIEPLAGYEPQQLCDPGPKPAVLAYTDIVRSAYDFSTNLGISRACNVGGRSEHKEGRAWDWGTNVAVPVERDAANEVISWLLATDEHGNEFAMARRLGVMYIIWDRHVWSAYQADTGWRPYSGPSPHTDHVHFSFSRAGAMGETSFWEGFDLSEFVGLAGLFSGFGGAGPPSFSLGGSDEPRPELGPLAEPLAEQPGSAGDGGGAAPGDPGAPPPDQGGLGGDGTGGDVGGEDAPSTTDLPALPPLPPAPPPPPLPPVTTTTLLPPLPLPPLPPPPPLPGL